MDLKKILEMHTEDLKSHYSFYGKAEPINYDRVVDVLYIFLEITNHNIAYKDFKNMCNSEKQLIDNLVKEINQEFHPSKEEIVINSLQKIRMEYEKIYSLCNKNDGYPEQDALSFMDISINDLEQQYGVK